MTFWRNIAGLAARRVDAAECVECPKGLPGEDPAFSTAVTALGAKLAKADGAVTDHELAYLEQVAHLFGLSHLTFHRLRATHLGSTPDDPYVVLDVAADAPDQTVREAWKRALSEAHPDRVMARGLPAEFVEVAHAKSAAINAAFDAIRRDRASWTGARA